MAENDQVKKLKQVLEGWRMVLVSLKSVFVWEQQWHPCAIVLTVSILFLAIWLMDLSTLATFAIVGLFFNFMDFIVPIISNTIWSPKSWNGQKEKMFEDICRSIVEAYNKTMLLIYNFYSMRDVAPIMYYLVSISMLSTLAWMASSINNMLLLYLFSTIVLLWPGIQHHRIFNIFSYIPVNFKMSSLKSE